MAGAALLVHIPASIAFAVLKLYARVVLGRASLLLASMTLRNLMLATLHMNVITYWVIGARFARLHRSAIVNVDRIRELRQDADENWEVTPVDATRLSAGREADVRLREASTNVA